MKATVAICTYNRARDIEEAVQSALTQQFDPDAYEVVVIDNRSTDDTAQRIHRLQAQFGARRLRYFYEETLGLSAARNRAIKEAKGDYILFLDDDAVASRGWIAGITEVFESDPAIGCVGGRINPIWEGGEPSWLPDMFKTLYTVLDYSSQITEMEAPRIPFGANVAFRSEVFKQFAPFREDLGRVGTNLLSNEESELIGRIRQKYTVYYTPFAPVDHKIERKRITRKWFLRRVYWQGISDAARSDRKAGAVLKNILKVGVCAILLLFSAFNQKKTIIQLRRILYSNGFIMGSLRLYRS